MGARDMERYDFLHGAQFAKGRRRERITKKRRGLKRKDEAGIKSGAEGNYKTAAKPKNENEHKTATG